ncbi:MAG: hypothetical protein FJ279_20370 [Planctomycetes bacterium]|nr:hypothetical protein [Planctomycetota bacterium]MBM4078282.1 hypothetical protein [Planctomycetota bacterium]MBM4087133.1 hypothetical protein [Planctomycetota bacterium]
MNDKLQALCQLQIVDTKIRNLEMEKQRLPSALAAEQRKLSAATATLAEKAKEAQTAQREVDRKDLDVRSLEVDINKLKTQLLAIQTNREYTALLTEIRTKETDKSKIEDEVFAAMSKVDEFKSECKRLTAEVEAEKAKLDAQTRTIEGAVREVEAKLRQEYAEREHILGKADKNALIVYERLLKKQDGVAIAAVKEEVVDGQDRYTCLGCNMNVTSQTVNRLMSTTELVHCHSCGRILYLEGG